MARSIFEGIEYEAVYKQDNYKVEYTDEDINRICIYCSSSGLYFPNNLEEFKKAFMGSTEKYEWLNHRMRRASKHMWIRDITKEFYVRGISEKYNTIEKLISFIKQESEGYEIVIIGSSGGGYIATLLGGILNAKYVLCFSGFFNLHLIDKDTWPLVDFMKMDPDTEKYYDLIPYIEKSSCTFFYFYPVKLEGDREQAGLVKNLSNVKKFAFDSAIHGIPFTNIKYFHKYDFLDILINLDKEEYLILAETFEGKIISKWKWRFKLLLMMQELNGK